MNLRTPEQVAAALAFDEPVSALVVGTSVYPHALADKLKGERRKLAVKPLTSAAHSASWFAAWLSTQWSRRDQIATLHVLLSPAEGESIHEGIRDSWTHAGSAAATLENYKTAFRDIRNATEGSTGLIVVYLAGHGVQVSGRSATVLLNDYLAPGQDDIYEAAVDSLGCHGALSDGRYAPTQFWFVDACRDASRAERDFEELNAGWAPGDRAQGSAEVAPLFLASAPWTSALAESYGRSLFSQALEWVFEGNAKSEIPGSAGEYGVLTGDLVNQLGPKVRALAVEHEREQRVEPTGIINFAVVHQFTDTDTAVNPPPEGKLATLRVDVKIDSYHLRSLTPFKAVSNDGTVTKERTGPGDIPLPPGRYTVSMRAPDGSWQSLPATAASEESTPPVTFDYEFPETMLTVSIKTADTDTIALVDVLEATAVPTAPGQWTFLPTSATPARVPRATFHVGDRALIASLPVNPRGILAEAACRVRADDEIGVRASFAPERMVSSTLQALLEYDAIGSAINVFQESSELLMYKYSEPVGAVLGGLTLHRTGHLRERESWVKNLARDFAWLPDGLGLQAALLRTSPDDDEVSAGLDLLLEASGHRPMYTDGLELIVDLLQRWPTDERKEERIEHLGVAGPLLARAVPSSLFLLTEHPQIRRWPRR